MKQGNIKQTYQFRAIPAETVRTFRFATRTACRRCHPVPLQIHGIVSKTSLMKVIPVPVLVLLVFCTVILGRCYLARAR